MKSDKEVRALIKKPEYGLSFGQVAQRYGAAVEKQDRGNCYYRVADATIILDYTSDSQSFCHELAHHLQYKAGGTDRKDFDEIVKFERQAERVAYHLHKNYFGWVPHQWFSAYRSKWHKQFLYEWHFGDPSPYLEEE